MTETSEKLGDYMLKGWVLTDQTCSRCRVTPLLRSPRTQHTVVSFCAQCDPAPGSSPARNIPNMPPPITIPDSSPSISSSSHVSRSSTPPTEVSSTLSSPTFAPPIETEDSLRRRAQSDQASTEIGQRLLKGWAMLADECPNSRCYGVPLMRPPKPGGGKDTRKFCVVCNTAYVSETDPGGWERLVPVEGQASNSTGAAAGPSSTARSQTSDTYMTASSKVSSVTPIRTAVPDITAIPTFSSSSQASLDASSQSLQLALQTLSTRLTTLSNSSMPLDPATIAVTAEAIGKVTQALSHVRQLQWSEKQAASS